MRSTNTTPVSRLRSFKAFYQEVYDVLPSPFDMQVFVALSSSEQLDWIRDLRMELEELEAKRELA